MRTHLLASLVILVLTRTVAAEECSSDSKSIGPDFARTKLFQRCNCLARDYSDIDAAVAGFGVRAVAETGWSKEIDGGTWYHCGWKLEWKEQAATKSECEERVRGAQAAAEKASKAGKSREERKDVQYSTGLACGQQK